MHRRGDGPHFNLAAAMPHHFYGLCLTRCGFFKEFNLIFDADPLQNPQQVQLFSLCPDVVSHFQK